MKKTFVMKAIAAIFATTMMSFTTAAEASAQNTFVYGQDGNTMTVSTLNADGLSITPKLKYEYQYDANGNLLEKKAYRWNKDNRSWQPAYLLNYLPTMLNTTRLRARLRKTSRPASITSKPKAVCC